MIKEIIRTRLKELEAKYLPKKRLLVLYFKCGKLLKKNSSCIIYFVKVVKKGKLLRLERLPGQPIFARKNCIFKHNGQFYTMKKRNLHREVTSLYEKFGKTSALGQIRLKTHDFFRLDYEFTKEGFVSIKNTFCSSHEFDYFRYLNENSDLPVWLRKLIRADKKLSKYKKIDGSSELVDRFESGPYGLLLAKINDVWRLVKI